MHHSIQRRPICHVHPSSRVSRSIASLGALALASTLLPAQTAQTPNKTGQAHPPAPLHAQAAPPAPDWPINDQPKPAAITWNNDQLRIDATNSSLQQIMTDVATATGASVDGPVKDERVFGAYGPAPARDVLTQLLQGAGYNIVMVGDQGQGAPRQIILSARNNNPIPQNNSRPTPEDNEEDIAPEPQYEPPPQNENQRPPNIPPQAMRPGFIPGAPGAYVNPQTGQPQQPIQQQQLQPLQQPNNQQN
jgi:hypothetical protein